jgi:hypothetical protein
MDTRLDDDEDGLFTLEEEEGCSRVLDELGDERAGLLSERRNNGVAGTSAAIGEAEGPGSLLLRRLAAMPFIRQYAGACSWGAASRCRRNTTPWHTCRR